MKQTFSDVISLIARLSIYGLTYAIVGAIVSAVISLVYVNGSAYCRDCNTGLGLCMAGYCAALFITPALIYGVISIFRRSE